jgi:hypothetical protein
MLAKPGDQFVDAERGYKTGKMHDSINYDVQNITHSLGTEASTGKVRARRGLAGLG